MRTDRACGTTLLAGVRYVWGPGDRPRVCRLCGEAQPRIVPARLMVSLPVHVSCFDLNIVYTNMSGVTPGMCGSGMRSGPWASIASSSEICTASIALASMVTSVSSVSSVTSASAVCHLARLSPLAPCHLPCAICVGCRLSLCVVVCRRLSYVVVCCVFAVVCASCLSLCLLTVLCSAFRLKIRLRAPFVVKLHGSHTCSLLRLRLLQFLRRGALGARGCRERYSNYSLSKAKNI